MERDQLLVDATENFLSLLDLAATADLGAPTPCEEWNIGQLIWHVTAGSTMAVHLVGGASQEEAIADIATPPPPAEELITSCRQVLGEQVAALFGPIEPTEIVHHAIGDVPAGQLLNFRIGDLVLHGWDLATALTVDADIPAALAQRVYDDMAPMAPFIGTIGMFGEGPSGTVDDDAAVQLRLLDLTGRRP